MYRREVSHWRAMLCTGEGKLVTGGLCCVQEKGS